MATSSAAVIAQQQALNAKGANLKVDGIMGPLTQAAITKYNTPAPAPTQTSNTANMGLSVKPYVAPVTVGTGALNSGTLQIPKPVAAPKPVTPAPMGVQAKTPVLNTDPKQTVLSPNQAKQVDFSNSAKTALGTPTVKTTNTTSSGSSGTSSSSFNPEILDIQKQLNAQGANLKEDGILGPLTKSAMQDYVSKNQTNTNNQSNIDTTTPITSTTQINNTPPGTDISNTGLLTSLANKGNQPIAQFDEKNKAIEDITQKIADLDKAQADQLAAIGQEPGTIEYKEGKGRVLQDQYLQQKNALTGQLNSLTGQLGALNTQQGLQVGATTSALGATQPVMQAGLLTNPQTGQPLNKDIVAHTVSTALQMINSGQTDVNSPQIQQMLAPFGFVGATALNDAQLALSGGNWNPTSQSASAQQQAGQGATVQGQAFTLDTGIKQLATLTPIINTVMKSSGINSTDSPLYNQQIGTYISKLGNPGAYSQFEYTMGELRKFQSQLLASGAGGIPTDVSNTINKTDISQLSLKDINTALETLDILGKNQKAVLQGQAKASGSTGYAGTPTAVSSNVPISTPATGLGSGITNPIEQYAAGLALNTLPNLASSTTQGGAFALGSKILKYIGL